MSIKDNVYVAGEKPFDITQHEWSDCELIFNRLDIDCNIHLDSKDVDCGIFINKSDAIAIANHFKLTAEDLK